MRYLILFLFCFNSFALLDKDTVFEWRSTGSVGILAGGGFNSTNATPGTDYSTANDPADSGTDLACADGDVAGDTVYMNGGGTADTAGIYLINSISTTTNANDTLNITIPASPGNDATEDKPYQILIGKNFGIGTNLKAGATTTLGNSTSYMDTGAVQRVEPSASGGGATSYGGMM